MSETFRVVYPQRVLEHFEKHFRDAQAQSVEELVIEASQKIDEALTNFPREFGDPVFDYRYLNATMYRRVIKPFIVSYAVHDELNIVFVKSIDKLPDVGF